MKNDIVWWETEWFKTWERMALHRSGSWRATYWSAASQGGIGAFTPVW